MNPLRKLVVFGLLVVTAACSTPVATERFYSLTDGASAAVPGAAASNASNAASSVQPLTIVIGAVSVPRLVDRPQIVTQDGSNRVLVSEQNQWAEPLPAAIGRALASRVARSLAGTDRPVRVASYPQAAITMPDLRINVDVQRFEAALGGQARIDALWTIRRPSGDGFVSGRSTAVQPTADGSYDAVVQAWSEGLARVEADLTAAIVALPR